MPAKRPSAAYEAGQMLTFVVQIDGMPHSEQVTVFEEEPFVVEAHATWCRFLRKGARAVLLRPMNGGFDKSEVELVSVNKFRNTYRLGFETPHWHATDRRRYPRFDVEAPLLMRKVSEAEGEVRIEGEYAFTSNMSAGGAWVRTDSSLPSGTVVQVELTLNGQPCRALAVVVRDDESKAGFAVEFLDFVGSSRYVLSEFLRLAA